MVEFEREIKKLKDILTNNELPGVNSQLKMAPEIRLEEIKNGKSVDAIKSSILILLYP